MALHRKIDALKMVAICFMMMHGTTLLAQKGWQDNGATVTLTDTTDKVGIGTTTPAYRLDVDDTAFYPFRLRKTQATVGGSWLFGISQDNGGDKGSLYLVPSEATAKFEITNAGLTNKIFIVDTETGNVGIGTTNPQSKLAVNGTVTAKEVKVTSTGWPDYVFDDDYNLMPLNEVAAYIASNGQLPEVPSSEDVATDGLSLGASQALLLKKIEELTLYMIAMQQENELLSKRVATLEQEE
ncbi:MAG: hypothetical protein IIA59_00290 [Candidatus Marinimicrobia bacterium]|nr:hypothetical protein [Candidatus Neomarinimicrobiota bacterium]